MQFTVTAEGDTGLRPTLRAPGRFAVPEGATKLVVELPGTTSGA